MGFKTPNKQVSFGSLKLEIEPKVNNFQNQGYQILPQAINPESIALLCREIARYTKTQKAYGIRDLHLKVKIVASLAKSAPIKSILHEYAGDRQFKLIKAIFFNKNLQHSWAVPWHQDKTIAVKEKAIVSGYKNWTVKKGVPHVQPPSKILEKIVTVRIALDEADADSGALRIIPRSHNLGILEQKEIDSITQQQESQFCSLKAGDILLMHPLLLHSSSKCISSNDQRIIHLEYSGCDLPLDLVWHC